MHSSSRGNVLNRMLIVGLAILVLGAIYALFFNSNRAAHLALVCPKCRCESRPQSIPDQPPCPEPPPCVTKTCPEPKKFEKEGRIESDPPRDSEAFLSLFSTLDQLQMKRVKVENISFYTWDAPIIQWVFGGGGAEHWVMKTFLDILKGGPNPSLGRVGDVLDIGSNTGIYSMIAASFGFKTYLFDLQPQCHAWQRAAIAVNRFDNLAQIMPYAIGRDNNLTLKVSPLTPCSGPLRASTATTFQNQVKDVDPNSFYEIRTHKLDDIYKGNRVILAKIDTEGFEAEVISGMKRILSEKKIKNIILECSPVIWREFQMNRERVANEIVTLWDYGFTDVTFFRNSHETDENIHFKSREELLDTLLHRDFDQNDVYFRLVE